MTEVLRAVLKGKHGADEMGKTVWEGVWCMREEDLENAAVTAPFRYERTETCAKDGADGEEDIPGIPSDGLYSGHFELHSVNGVNRFSEKNVLIRFAKDGQVEGEGANKLGKFKLKGTFDMETGIIKVFREYSAKKRQRTARSQARIQRELSLGQADVATPAKTHTQELSGNSGVLLSKINAALDALIEADVEKWFCNPVDAVKLGLADYHDIIAKPMDLGTVKKRYNQSEYDTPGEMCDDILLTFSNAVHYNARGNPVYKKAIELQAMFHKKYNSIRKKFNSGEISTPAPPASRRIGKRLSIPKIIFEPENHRRQPLEDEASPTVADQARKKRRRSSGASPRNNAEMNSLRSQLELLQENLNELTSNMYAGASNMLGNPSVIDGESEDWNTAIPAGESDRQVSFNVMRRLGRDIHLLPEDRLAKVVEIIQESGFQLPINDAGEVQLDISELDYSTIQKLRKYVTRHMPKKAA